MLFTNPLRALVLCLVAGLLLATSSVAYAQEEPPVEPAAAVVDDEGPAPLPSADERPMPEPVVGPDDPDTAVVIAPAPGEIVVPPPAPTGDDVVISPSGGETIGIEEDSGFEWGVAVALAAGVVAVALILIRIVRATQTHRREPVAH